MSAGEALAYLSPCMVVWKMASETSLTVFYTVPSLWFHRIQCLHYERDAAGTNGPNVALDHFLQSGGLLVFESRPDCTAARESTIP